MQELELYDPSLLSKPAVLLVNKMDTKHADKLFAEFQEQMEAGRGKQSYAFGSSVHTLTYTHRLTHVYNAQMHEEFIYLCSRFRRNFINIIG